MTAAETPCQTDPALWDCDRRMSNVDIAACIRACRTECRHYTACRAYLADCDINGVKVHGVVAGQYRPQPTSHHQGGRPSLYTVCNVCGRECVASGTKTRNPAKYYRYAGRERDGLCQGCHKQAKRAEERAAS